MCFLLIWLQLLLMILFLFFCSFCIILFQCIFLKFCQIICHLFSSSAYSSFTLCAIGLLIISQNDHSNDHIFLYDACRFWKSDWKSFIASITCLNKHSAVNQSSVIFTSHGRSSLYDILYSSVSRFCSTFSQLDSWTS